MANIISKGDSDGHCPKDNLSCPWTGPTRELDNHLLMCVFQPFQSVLKKLVDENRQLQDQIKKQEVRINEQEIQLKYAMEQLTTYQRKPCNACRTCHYINNGGLKGYYHVHKGKYLDIDDIRCHCNCHKEH